MDPRRFALLPFLALAAASCAAPVSGPATGAEAPAEHHVTMTVAGIT